MSSGSRAGASAGSRVLLVPGVGTAGSSSRSPTCASTSGSTFRSSTATRAAVSVDDVHELAPPLPGDVDEHGAAEPDGRGTTLTNASELGSATTTRSPGTTPARSQPGGRPRRAASLELGDGQRRSGLGRREARRRDAAEATATRAGRRRSPECGQELPRVALERRRASSARRRGTAPGRARSSPRGSSRARGARSRRRRTRAAPPRTSRACRGRSTCRSRA